MLVNLLTNAQYRPGRGTAQAPAVTVTTSPAGERRVRVSVRDRGAGISADDLPRIFDPYFTTRRGGTGSALAISKNVIDGLGAC
ncbi:MAG: ATP-binding protein [Vicinamibacterales bacterium]